MIESISLPTPPIGSTKLLCRHCNEEVIIPLYSKGSEENTHAFCCQGCVTVYEILNQKGLSDYYQIKNESQIYKRRAPVEIKNEFYQYLDDENFIKEYSYLNAEKKQTMEFYLEGIHCLACLWLIEKLPEILPDVYGSRLDMAKSVATISKTAEGSFAKIASELALFGYRPHPLKKNEEVVHLKKREDRLNLIRIGIAGAGAGNIMLFSDFIYAGADGAYADWFSLFIVGLALPVLTFSAWPFYKNAYNAIKSKTISIDIPIAFSLLIGLIFGIYNLSNGIHEYYLDTLTDLVFFVLLSRYFLQKVQEEGLSANDLNFFYHNDSILKKNAEGLFIDTHPRFLKVGDIIKLKENEMIPVDGTIINGDSKVNNSLLTGESRPIRRSIGDQVYSGTQNLNSEIIVQVEKLNEDTRLGKILKNVEGGWNQKSTIVGITNKISKYFLIITFVLAGIILFYFWEKNQALIGIKRALSLLIVTCPCAMALATPLALTNTLNRALKKGIVIKNDLVLEKISKVKSIFLDKTGTITFGKLCISKVSSLKVPHIPIQDIIWNLEKKSVHPVAKTLLTYAKGLGTITDYHVQDHEEILGVGVEGKILNHFYEIKENAIFENKIKVFKFHLEDTIRPESKTSVKMLQHFGLKTSILSGDEKEVVEKIATETGIPLSAAFYQTGPEEKLKLISEKDFSMMVGDGANDAMALSKSFVGVAVHGSMDISLRAADVYLATPGIKPIVDLVTISKETISVIKRNLAISFFYNLVAVFFVFNGLINPFWAAVLMPISSVSVVLSTLIGTQKLNRALRI